MHEINLEQTWNLSMVDPLTCMTGDVDIIDEVTKQWSHW